MEAILPHSELTFAQVDKDRKSKWKESSETYSKNVLTEELKA